MEEKYWEVFNTDWNKGSESTMTSTERSRIHDLWLEYTHLQLKNTIKPEVLNDQETITGFIEL